MRTSDWPTIIFPILPEVAPHPTHMLYSLTETVFTCSECRMMIDDNSQVEKEKAMRFCSWHNAKPGISKCRGPVIISNSTFPPRYAERYSALAENVALSASAPSLFLSHYQSISATCWAQKKYFADIGMHYLSCSLLNKGAYFTLLGTLCVFFCTCGYMYAHGRP